MLTYSCKDDDPVPENPEELITTVRVVFHDHSTQTDYIQEFKDLDGDGGQEPTITTTPLPPNTTFDMTVFFLNETETPPEDITEEVEEEAEEHQVFYVIDSNLKLTNTYSDEDGDGNPIGLVNMSVSSEASQGNFRVVLRHEPDKLADGVADGDITNAGGETSAKSS